MFPTSNNQEEKKAWYILRVDMFGPRTLFNDYTRFTSYQIYLRNGDHSIHGSWNEKDGFLIRDGESLMENELHTPTLLVLLIHRLAEYGIRFSKVPARLYTSKGISRKSVENWIKNVMKAYEDDRMQETRDNALDILKYEGDKEDTVVELRKKWGDVVSVLKDKRFDEIVNQYSCFSHEIGISALGQELTACGYALYNLDEDDIYLLELIPQAEMGVFEKKCHKYGNIANYSNSRIVISAYKPGILLHASRCRVCKWYGPMTISAILQEALPVTSPMGNGNKKARQNGKEHL